MLTTLYVGNLAYEASDADLRGLLSQFGKVVAARVALERDMLRPRGFGFGFVEMSTALEAEVAIRALGDFQLKCQHIVVNMARPKMERYERRAEA